MSFTFSPQGYDCLRIFSPTEVAYLELTDSMILRLYGIGTVIIPGTKKWDELAQHFDLLPGARQIIAVDIHEVKRSCGYSIPFFSYSGERDTLQMWAVQKGDMDGIKTPLGHAHRSENLDPME